MPAPTDGEAVSTRWIAAVAEFSGLAGCHVGGVPTGDTTRIECHGMCAIAVTTTRLVGILAPEDARASAVWFAPARADLRVRADGQVGVFKKRPAALTLISEDWGIRLSIIARHFARHGRYQPSQEAALLRQLTA